VGRLVRCLPDGIDRSSAARDAIAELLACFPVYRSYLPAGIGRLEAAAAEASARRPDLAQAIAALIPVLGDPTLEVARRFQQTTGPVMAKGVEDMAFYRQTRLGSLTEVGGDPSVFALSVDGFHRAQTARQANWPHTMTALSTHDTKRGEDVRARLSVIAELEHDEWAAIDEGLRARATTGHAPLDSLLFQAAIGAWPITRERLHRYAEKAAREGAERTSWSDPDAAFEAGLHRFVDDLFDDAVLHELVTSAADRLTSYGWSNSLAAKLLQLAGPGVPDVYQGSELWETSLADPDNRRPVDFALLRRLLAELDAGAALPRVDESGAAKLLVTSRALRLRRDRPELFTRYTPMTVVGEAAGHAIAFDRGGVVAVATRLPLGLERRGGWGQTALLRHAGPTVDVLTGRRYAGTELALGDVLSVYPVALLAPEEVV
jgi:(1->4)-alpha-D-glucan 1-alpha-D-glucosylmutase